MGKVLQACVEEYIATGQPVSSQAVLRRSGLDVSSATIRNDLAKLESYGFVVQPHTSAGRMPTDQGYRFYVDHCTPGRLRTATRAKIDSFFSDVHLELAKLLAATSDLLSDLSHYPAVVIGPGIAGEVIRGIHLVTLGHGVLLAVTITGTGRVTQEVVRVGFDVSDAVLDEAESIVAELLVGRTIEQGTELFAEKGSELARGRVGELLTEALRSLSGAKDSSSEVFVGGASQLASLWEDLARVHSLLEVLERDSTLRAMFEGAADGTAVRIGAELSLGEDDVAVVSTTYVAGDGGKGRVGVIGPTRMDYRRNIRLVEEVGEGLADRIGR
jgi:heat-inducible transcriptional repressor